MFSARHIHNNFLLNATGILQDCNPLRLVGVLLEAPFIGFAGELFLSIPVLTYAKIGNSWGLTSDENYELLPGNPQCIGKSCFRPYTSVE